MSDLNDYRQLCNLQLRIDIKEAENRKLLKSQQALIEELDNLRQLSLPTTQKTIDTNRHLTDSEKFFATQL